jgi:ABC-type sugar transport system permease subunit
MAVRDHSIESFKELLAEIKEYLKLQKEFTLIQLTEKLGIFFSALILVIVFLVLGVVALFYLLFCLAYLIEPYVGGMKGSFAIIVGVDLLIIAVIAIFRKKFIVKPIVNFLAHLLLDDEKDEVEEEEKEEEEEGK